MAKPMLCFVLLFLFIFVDNASAYKASIEKFSQSTRVSVKPPQRFLRSDESDILRKEQQVVFAIEGVDPYETLVADTAVLFLSSLQNEVDDPCSFENVTLNFDPARSNSSKFFTFPQEVDWTLRNVLCFRTAASVPASQLMTLQQSSKYPFFTTLLKPQMALMHFGWTLAFLYLLFNIKKSDSSPLPFASIVACASFVTYATAFFDGHVSSSFYLIAADMLAVVVLRLAYENLRISAVSILLGFCSFFFVHYRATVGAVETPAYCLEFGMWIIGHFIWALLWSAIPFFLVLLGELAQKRYNLRTFSYQRLVVSVTSAVLFFLGLPAPASLEDVEKFKTLFFFGCPFTCFAKFKSAIFSCSCFAKLKAAVGCPFSCFTKWKDAVCGFCQFSCFSKLKDLALACCSSFSAKLLSCFAYFKAGVSNVIFEVSQLSWSFWGFLFLGFAVISAVVIIFTFFSVQDLLKILKKIIFFFFLLLFILFFFC